MRDLEGMGEAGAVEVVFTGPEDLCFVLEAAERRGVKDAVAVDLKRCAIIAGIGAFRKALGIKGVVELVSHG